MLAMLQDTIGRSIDIPDIGVGSIPWYSQETMYGPKRYKVPVKIDENRLSTTNQNDKNSPCHSPLQNPSSHGGANLTLWVSVVLEVLLEELLLEEVLLEDVLVLLVLLLLEVLPWNRAVLATAMVTVELPRLLPWSKWGVLMGVESTKTGINKDTVNGCEILHHLGWLKAYKYWDRPPSSTGAGFRHHPPYGALAKNHWNLTCFFLGVDSRTSNIHNFDHCHKQFGWGWQIDKIDQSWPQKYLARPSISANQLIN